jgi:hypothetical protein
LVGKPEGKSQHGSVNIDGSIILKYMLKKYGVRLRTGFIWLRIGGLVAGCYANGNEPLKCGQLLE